jgi:hypothetical protein
LQPAVQATVRIAENRVAARAIRVVGVANAADLTLACRMATEGCAVVEPDILHDLRCAGIANAPALTGLVAKRSKHANNYDDEPHLHPDLPMGY